MAVNTGWTGTLSTESPRYEQWRQILQSDTVPISTCFPTMTILGGKIITSVYDLDLARLDAGQRSRLIDFIVEKFGQDREHVEQNLDTEGFAIKSEDIEPEIPRIRDLKFEPGSIIGICNACGKPGATMGAPVQSHRFPDQAILVMACSEQCIAKMASDEKADIWLASTLAEMERGVIRALRMMAAVASPNDAQSEATAASASDDMAWPEEV